MGAHWLYNPKDGHFHSNILLSLIIVLLFDTVYVTTHSLLSVHEMAAIGGSYVCLSAHMFRLQNRWMDLDEIWYGRYAIRGYPKILLFYFLHSVVTDMAMVSVTDSKASNPF
jgi:hypothetical protein